MEVNVAPGVKGRLILKKGESLERATRQFAEKYHLNKNATELLKRLINQEIAKTCDKGESTIPAE